MEYVGRCGKSNGGKNEAEPIIQLCSMPTNGKAADKFYGLSDVIYRFSAQRLMEDDILKFIQNINHFSSVDIGILKQLDCIVKWTLNVLGCKVRYDRSFIGKFGLV